MCQGEEQGCFPLVLSSCSAVPGRGRGACHWQASRATSLDRQDFREVMFPIQARIVLHLESHSPETPQEARRSRPWLSKACACCLHYSYRHIFLRTSRGPVSELPTHQPKAIKTPLTSIWLRNIIMAFSHTPMKILSLGKARFYNHDLARAEEPKVGATALPLCLPARAQLPLPTPLPPWIPTLEEGAKSQLSYCCIHEEKSLRLMVM